MPRPGPSPEDRFAIADLCAQYAWCLDTGDTEGLVACFAEDAIFDEVVVCHGRDQIRRLVKQAFHDNPLFAGRQHEIGQPLFEPDAEGRADAWRMKSFAHVFVLRDTGPSLYWTGHYTDVVQKIDGEWLFRYRKASRWQGEVLDGFPEGTIAKVGMPANFNAPVDGSADGSR